ncbi:MAG: YCF48-related protein, partial [Pirellulaceae bacterium]
RGWTSLLALVAWCAVAESTRPVAAQADRWAPEMLEDAELTSVWFHDSDQGWVVGDRGVILHTEDGGRHWQLQRTPETCRLEAVHFLDANLGWIVGGRVHPYTHHTSCVVLRTHDGGRTWTVIPGLTLPALKTVRFLNAQQGWAVGNGSALYPTGIFRTEDGGRSWSTLPAGITGRWTTADFRDLTAGVAAGHDGQLARVTAPNVESVNMASVGPRPLRAVRLRDAQRGWLVGDGGLVLQTGDGGLSWQAPAGALPADTATLFDFRSVAVWEDHIWAAGAPGSCVLHSGDNGQTWELLRTGQNVPLRAMTFVDPQRGWAVGALGTILSTRDGGKTWRRLRSGGARAALLGLFSEPKCVPWELFAWESGNEGYLGVAEVFNRRDVEVRAADDAPAEDGVTAAISAVGGCASDQAWQFPLRQAGLKLSSQDLIGTWDRVNDGHSVALLEELMVRRIRQWRPEVVVTEAASPRGDRPLSHIINQLVLSAVRNAADATSHPDHATVAGLQPWTVKKVFSVDANDEQATVTLPTAQLAARLGCSVADQAAAGYALVCGRYEPVPVTVGFRLLLDELPQAVGRRDIFSGIFLQAGGEARRVIGPPTSQDIEALTRAAQMRRNVEQIFAKSPDASAQAAGWLGQVQNLTKSMNGAGAGQVLYQLGQRYLAAGEWQLAAQALEQLVERYPDHPLSETALVWLIQYYASSEAGWQLRRQTHMISQSTTAEVTHSGLAGGVQPAGHAGPLNAPAGIATVQTGFETRNATTTASFDDQPTERAARALHFAKLVQRSRPVLFAEPWVQFPMSMAYRMQGVPREAERFYHRLSAHPIATDWSRCASTELWLSHGQGRPPKTLYNCRTGPTRPRLDGQLDDDVWRQAEHLELTSAQHDDSDWPAAAMLAYDAEFLYLAANCRKAPGAQYSVAAGPRPRDPDLSDSDRVDVLLDVDRDYVSYYRLTVDHCGWTGEACLGSVHWNPTWYVAYHATDQDWTFEAAIPLDELAQQPPESQDVWAVGVQRIVPRVGIQSYTQPASVNPRGEGFAVMVFQ